MSGFSYIECIGGKDVFTVKPVFSTNSELIYVANGNKVDVHSSHTGDFIQSLNSEVSISDNIVALFLHPIKTKLLVALFENGFLVSWFAESGDIERSSKLQSGDSTISIVSAKCHVNVIDNSSVDIFTITKITNDCVTSKKMKVFAYETGQEKIIQNKTFNNLKFEDVESLNIIHFGGSENIKSNGKTISGRYLCVTTGPKMFVMFLRCIFDPRCEQDSAIHDQQEIQMKSCWYQMGSGRSYCSVTCHPTEYNVAAGDSTGRVVVYTGVFLHAQDKRHVQDGGKLHPSEDKLTNESSDSDTQDEHRESNLTKKSKSGAPSKDTPTTVKRSAVSRHMSWAITTVYHWHSFPVLDVLYSETGHLIFSGGGERVLAEWTLPHCRHPRTLPRLPGTIANITGAPNGQMIVSTRDNSLHLVDQTSLMLQKVLTSIQRLVKDEYRPPAPVVRSYLHYDPRTSSLLLNGGKGHVQFFSLTSNSLLFNLDITGENIVSELHHDTSAASKAHTAVAHSDVLAACVSHDGLCLASVERLDENHVLKFWNYSAENKQFKMSSVISKPHKGCPINHLRFSPLRTEFNDSHTYTCVTSGGDDQYTVWTCTHRDASVSWSKDKEDQYHGLQAGPVGFSQDGSILAVGFGPCLTLWDRNFQFKCSLSHACDKSDRHYIRFLKWGHGPECGNLLVGACSAFVRVWNTILAHNIWQVPLSASLLVADPGSSYMALFTSTRNIYVFKPSSSKPESVISTRGHNSPVAACFVSSKADGGGSPVDSQAPWYETTQLYFLTDQLELMYLRMLNAFEEKITAPLLSYKSVQVKTPIASMRAAEVVEVNNAENPSDDEATYENYANLGAIDKFLSYNPVSMAPLQLYCAHLLRSTLNKKKQAHLNSSRNPKVTDGSVVSPRLDLDSMSVHSFDDVSRTRAVSSLSTMDDTCVNWIQNLV